MSNSDVISTENLTKVYGVLTAVDSLDLSVGAGEIFGLLGPNGAGKTTTVGMLTTRVCPSSGRAVVGGVDVVAQPALAKQAIGVVPQVNNLDRALTVEENLYFHGRYFGMSAGESRAATTAALRQFRLADRAGADTDTLSGGMIQRLMLARAILHRPRILFLDEPTAGLDPQSRLALWEVVRELHDQGQTILLTTHYMEEADQLCSRVAIMDHGRILALDQPSALKHSLGVDTVVSLSAEGDLAQLALHLRESVSGAVRSHVLDGQVRLELREAGGALPRVMAAAEAGGFTVTDLSAAHPTLESVFLGLTGKDLRE